MKSICDAARTLRPSALLPGWMLVAASTVMAGSLSAATQPSYYAHESVHDEHGVIAPWYQGLNGQLDERLNIAVNVYKRYPWVDKPKAVMAAPDFIYNSHWSIQPDGTIVIPPTTDWMCGDLCARAWSIIKGLTAYYQYSGDPMAFIYIPLTVDYILDYGLTATNSDWPLFPISTPTRGKAYGKCDPTGRNQLDLCAITGIEVLRAYKLTGTPRYLEMAKHWGDVFAAKCQLANPELSPWNRYVDPSVVGWSDVLTGTTSIIVDFLDDLIRLGYTGKEDRIVKARDAGRRFLNEQMLPAWWVNDTWGRTYWDWDNPMMCGMVSMCADHFMKYPQAYPNWQTDVRNMLVAGLEPQRGRPGLARRRLQRGLGLSRVLGLLRHVSFLQPVHGRANAHPVRRSGRQRMGARDRPADDAPGHLRQPAQRRREGRFARRPSRHGRVVEPGAPLAVVPGARSHRLAPAALRSRTGRTTSFAPPPSSATFSTKRAVSATPPSTLPAVRRRCCGWPFVRPQSRPMACD